MQIKITSVKALHNYSLFIIFSDGSEGILDLSNHAGKGVFKKWDDNNNFGEVFVSEESGAITWPGEIDIDSLNAWFIINKIEPEKFLQSQKQYAQY